MLDGWLGLDFRLGANFDSLGVFIRMSFTDLFSLARFTHSGSQFEIDIFTDDQFSASPGFDLRQPGLAWYSPSARL
jgi:hypothetical protein